METNEPSEIGVDGLPTGINFDSMTNTISGTPTIGDWSETERTRDFAITVSATDDAGNTSLETFIITVQRDADVENPDNSENAPDIVAPIITPIDDFTAVENQSIEAITIETDEESLIDVIGLPEGIIFNPETNDISGTPIILEWLETEETRDFSVVVSATDEAGNTSLETFVVTVQRDTDNGENQTTPGHDDTGRTKDTTPPVITPVPDGSAVENEPMEDIVVETDEPSNIVVSGLPAGITYDPDNNVIGGTPVINDWADGETERNFTVTITAEDEAGNTSTFEFDLTIERNLSGLGGAGDGSDTEDSSTLPTTGESQNIFTNLIGITTTSMGALLLVWNKIRNNLGNKLKKD